MKLYLVQHGQALAEELDPQRGLSEKGIKETQNMAEFCRRKELEVDLIWHSKKLRSFQTAKIFSQYLGDIELVERDDLNPKDPVDKFSKEIEKLNKDLMIVGHLPFLQKLTAKLLVNSVDCPLITFRYSGIVCLGYEQDWKISWFIIPENL